MAGKSFSDIEKQFKCRIDWDDVSDDEDDLDCIGGAGEFQKQAAKIHAKARRRRQRYEQSAAASPDNPNGRFNMAWEDDDE